MASVFFFRSENNRFSSFTSSTEVFFFFFWLTVVRYVTVNENALIRNIHIALVCFIAWDILCGAIYDIHR